MLTAIIIIAVVISILLILVVLVQKSKGGGLASNVSGANQIMGVRRTNEFIEKATWTLAAIVAFLSIISVFFISGSVQGDGHKADIKTEQAVPADFDTDATGGELPLPAPTPEN